MKEKISSEKIEKIIEMKKAGRKTGEISGLLMVSVSSVRNYWAKHNKDRNSKSEPVIVSKHIVSVKDNNEKINPKIIVPINEYAPFNVVLENVPHNLTISIRLG